jgi:flagellar biosynthetic protein FliQ
MDQDLAVYLVQRTLTTALMIAAPMLCAGLLVGFCVSLFQAVTSINEQTLSLIPKMLAVVTVLLLLLPWITRTVLEYAHWLYTSLPSVGPGG